MKNDGPRYPNITVRLSGANGNAFAIMGKALAALRDGGIDAEMIAKYREEAMSGNYDHLLQTTMAWVEVE